MIQELISSLLIPLNSRVDKRIPKKAFVDSVFISSGDKKLIQESIEELQWIAALKPSNIAVKAFKNDVREYIEIAVISVRLRSETKSLKVAQIIHRAIPYPVFLIISSPEALAISLAHKRWAQASNEKFVIEDFRKTLIAADSHEGCVNEFLQSLGLSRLAKNNLFDLYQGWMNRLIALESSYLTGTFKLLSDSDTHEKTRRDLENHAKLCAELKLLKSQAAKEKQISRRVNLNLKIKEMENSLTSLVLGLKDNEE